MLEMLLKNMGVNPEEIKKQINDVAVKSQETINHFDARINGVDLRLSALETQCDAILNKLGSIITLMEKQ